VQTVDPDENLDDALKVMASNQVRRLPVVENGRLVGVLAQADIAEADSGKMTGQLVHEISQN
jgi:CBS domain-containing protein